MNDDSCAIRSRRRKGQRLAGAVALAVGIALLTAACGGSSSSSGSSQAGGSTTHQKYLAFAQCMRSHGVPNWPDPTSNNVFGIKNHSVNLQSSQVQAAQKACQHLLPNNGQPTQAQQQQAEKQLLKFSQCMRSHGVPNFPDPNSKGQLRIGDKSGINPQSSQFQAAQRACQSLQPAGPGG